MLSNESAKTIMQSSSGSEDKQSFHESAQPTAEVIDFLRIVARLLAEDWHQTSNIKQQRPKPASAVPLVTIDGSAELGQQLRHSLTTQNATRRKLTILA
jgi:hypothetical protein